MSCLELLRPARNQAVENCLKSNEQLHLFQAQCQRTQLLPYCIEIPISRYVLVVHDRPDGCDQALPILTDYACSDHRIDLCVCFVMSPLHQSAPTTDSANAYVRTTALLTSCSYLVTSLTNHLRNLMSDFKRCALRYLQLIQTIYVGCTPGRHSQKKHPSSFAVVSRIKIIFSVGTVYLKASTEMHPQRKRLSARMLYDGY